MSKKETSYYNISDHYWHRIHFVRPRFKSNIENVLLYMATECCRIPKLPCKEYNDRYMNAIRMFPGNIGMAEKTLHNWRTEIPALFGFYTEDKEAGFTETSKMATFLHENQDLTQFLRFFLLSFQFPGGHMKPQDIREIIEKGIKFKPACMIVKVLMEGNNILSSKGSQKEMSVSDEEVTYCIFNDIRSTSGVSSPQTIARTILENRAKKLKYYNRKDHKIFSNTGQPRSKGDVTRYAKDILDYMEIANILESHNGYYSLKGNEREAIRIFAEDKSFFDGYDDFYMNTSYSTSDISQIEPYWFDYVNESLQPDMFKTNISRILEENKEIDVVFHDRIQEVVADEDKTTKDIGNLGEAIIYSHERMRLKLSGFEQFANLVQIVDSPSYHPGFDIDSYEADETEDHRYIEVKTTVSKKTIQMYGFHMSPNEWRVANTIKEHYCVYRLMLSENSRVLIVLRNPVMLYKTDQIDALPRDGMEITFKSETFKPTELLVWKK